MKDGSGKRTFKWVVEDTDRHGNVRLYLRKPGCKKVRLREEVGTPAFDTEYQRALASFQSGRIAGHGGTLTGRAASGSFQALCVSYFASPVFSALDISTRNWRRRSLEKVCDQIGALPVAGMESRDVKRLRDELASTPGAANNRLKALKALFAWAIEAEEVTRNPARDVKLIHYKTAGHHTWTDAEVRQFEERHPVGSKARLAMTLLLYTAGRREDAVRLGPQHVRDGRIRFTQAKNEHRNPVKVDLPLSPELADVAAKTPTGHLAFLVTEYGKPFSANGFGGWFRDRCNEAGLLHCSAHGLRKAAATGLANAGCTPHEIMAVTGHQSLEEVERYTRAAAKAKLADSGFAKVAAAKG